MNKLLLPLLMLAAAVTAAAVISIAPGETGVISCAGDELVITQTSTLSADYNCVVYTPTATSTIAPTATFAPTATIIPPTVTPTDIPPTATATFTPQPSGTFLDTFDGDPSNPLAWNPDNWDVTVHSRNRETWYNLQSMNAQHGPNCEPPMATHSISTYEDAVYQCKNHIMTAIKADGYGLIYLTPDHKVDFTNGTVTIRFDMSTLRTSTRDWIDIYVSPMEDHLQLALEDWLPDLSGQPKRAIHIKMGQFNNKTTFEGAVYNNHNKLGLNPTWWVVYDDYLTPSATERTTFELQISRTHVKFGIPELNLWWIDTDIAPLDWSEGVVQFGHHSYTPGKDCYLPGGCGPNTWHWDNISIDPAVPFTMIKSDRRYTNSADGGVVNFDSPAPSNANLRFAGIGGNMEVSFDNGVTWQAARIQSQTRYNAEAFWSYFTPIPEGTQSVRFRAQNWWGGHWMVKDISIWSE